MPYEKIEAKIAVVVDFNLQGRPQVRSFQWQERHYAVMEQTLVVKARKGREVVWVFHVATSSGAYKLRFNTDDLSWYLVEITWE